MRAALILLLLAGCATTGEVPRETTIPVSKACMKKEDVPAKPKFSSDLELKAMRADTFVTTLYAERLARIDYEERLEALIPGCVEGSVEIPAATKLAPAPATKRPWEFWKP